MKRSIHSAPEEGILRELEANPQVARMKEYIQHGRVTTLEHGERVARMSCRLNRTLHLRADEGALARGALLHDFYLYDWHKVNENNWLHGFRHPERAARNAALYAGAGEKEQEIIRSHMWPLTLTHIPRSREAWLVCFADKWCSLEETLFRR